MICVVDETEILFGKLRTFGDVQQVINSTYIIVTIPSEKENK